MDTIACCCCHSHFPTERAVSGRMRVLQVSWVGVRHPGWVSDWGLDSDCRARPTVETCCSTPLAEAPRLCEEHFPVGLSADGVTSFPACPGSMQVAISQDGFPVVSIDTPFYTVSLLVKRDP